MDSYGTDWGSKVVGRPERIRWSRFEVSPLAPFCLVMPKLDAKDGWSASEEHLHAHVETGQVVQSLC